MGDRQNPYEMHARAMKALHIADALTRANCSLETAREFDESDRRRAEAAAMVREASSETWKVVFSILERRERMTREEADAAETAMFTR